MKRKDWKWLVGTIVALLLAGLAAQPELVGLDGLVPPGEPAAQTVW